MNASVQTTSHRMLVISAITAAVAVTLCALVAIAYMLGWLPSRTNLATPVSSTPAPVQQSAGSSASVALLPGETVVTPETTPAPVSPPPSPAPTTPDYKRASPSTAEPIARNVEPKPAPKPRPPAPKAPTYSAAAPQRTICENCGTVASTTTYPDRWEVRVRFEDGTSQVVRYRNPPDFSIGQRVRLEDGRLMRDD